MRLRDLVRRATERSPDAMAVVDDCGAHTYAALHNRAEQLASALRGLGVAPGDRVGVWATKSMHTIAAMQAALRLGAAYVPLDPASPTLRIRRVVDEAGLAALITTPDRIADLSATGETPPWLGVDRPLPATQALPWAEVTEDDLAYILFTSGSTGDPKGVCVGDGNAVAFVEWAHNTLNAQSSDRFANHAAFHFDLSVLDLYVAFAAGACVSIVPASIAFAPSQLVRFMADHRISVWYSVPSALTLMLRHGGLATTSLPHLRAILFAGEPFAIPHMRALREAHGHCRFLNLYGPTETNVCTWYEVTELPADRITPVPIGQASCGNQVWAETSTGERTSPGEEGELVVDGPTVMQGYWGRPPQAGPYRTGDWVRHLPSGDYAYVGRIDGMVKVRGHRVELGDVEAALLTHPDIVDACVVVCGEGIDAVLVAWVVIRDDDVPTLLSIKAHCAQRLPPYMTVGELRAVPALPRTNNGKINRQQLRRSTAA